MAKEVELSLGQRLGLLLLPLLDQVVMDALTGQVLVAVLDLVHRLARQPVYLDLLHVLLSELLQAQDHHVVVHPGEFAPVVVLKYGDRCTSLLLPTTALDSRLRCNGAHRVRRLLRLHTWRQKVSIDKWLHCVKALLVGVLARNSVSLFIRSQVEFLG